MNDTQPQTATGKVHWGLTMSLDGFVAGPNHEMDWMTGFTTRPGLIEEYIQNAGAVLAGRDGFDSAIGDSRPWGGEHTGLHFIPPGQPWRNGYISATWHQLSTPRPAPTDEYVVKELDCFVDAGALLA